MRGVAIWRCVAFLAIALARNTLLSAQEDGEQPVPWEYRPFDVRVLVAVAPDISGQLELERQLIEALPLRAAASLGGYWQVTAASAGGNVRAKLLHNAASLDIHEVPEDLRAADKLLVLAVTLVGQEQRLSAREFDLATQRWNELVEQPGVMRGETLSSAGDVLLAAFGPVGRIDTVDGTTATLKLRGAALLPRGAAQSLVADRWFVPSVLGPDAATGATPVPWTFLRSASPGGIAVKCDVVTALGGKFLPDYHPQQTRLAVALPRSRHSTRLILMDAGEPPQPLAGYDVFVRAAQSDSSDAPWNRAGRSDSQGRLTIEASEEVVWMRVEESGQRLLEVPMAPGLAAEQQLLIPDDSASRSIALALNRIRDELLALAARQAVLASRREALTAAGKPEESAKIEAQLAALAAPESLRADLLKSEQSIGALPSPARERLQAQLERLKSQLGAK